MGGSSDTGPGPGNGQQFSGALPRSPRPREALLRGCLPWPQAGRATLKMTSWPEALVILSVEFTARIPALQTPWKWPSQSPAPQAAGRAGTAAAPRQPLSISGLLQRRHLGKCRGEKQTLCEEQTQLGAPESCASAPLAAVQTPATLTGASLGL